MAHKIKIIILALSIMTVSSFVLAAPNRVWAACDSAGDPCGNPGASAQTPAAGASTTTDPCQDLTGANLTSCQTCDNGKASPTDADIKNCLNHNKIIQDLQTIVDFLSAAVALVVIGSLIFGGIQYSLAGDQAEMVTKAKKRITNSAVAMAAFLLMFAFIQWLIPGGIFS